MCSGNCGDHPGPTPTPTPATCLGSSPREWFAAGVGRCRPGRQTLQRDELVALQARRRGEPRDAKTAGDFPLRKPGFLSTNSKLFTSNLFKKNFFYPHLRTCVLILERGGGRKKERERETYQLVASCIRSDGTEPAPQACALTRNRTCDLSVYGTMLQPTEPHQPGLSSNLFTIQHGHTEAHAWATRV